MIYSKDIKFYKPYYIIHNGAVKTISFPRLGGPYITNETPLYEAREEADAAMKGDVKDE